MLDLHRRQFLTFGDRKFVVVDVGELCHREVEDDDSGRERQGADYSLCHRGTRYYVTYSTPASPPLPLPLSKITPLLTSFSSFPPSLYFLLPFTNTAILSVDGQPGNRKHYREITTLVNHLTAAPIPSPLPRNSQKDRLCPGFGGNRTLRPNPPPPLSPPGTNGGKCLRSRAK